MDGERMTEDEIAAAEAAVVAYRKAMDAFPVDGVALNDPLFDAACDARDRMDDEFASRPEAWLAAARRAAVLEHERDTLHAKLIVAESLLAALGADPDRQPVPNDGRPFLPVGVIELADPDCEFPLADRLPAGDRSERSAAMLEGANRQEAGE